MWKECKKSLHALFDFDEMRWVELQLLPVHVALSHHPYGLSVYEMLVCLLFQYYNVFRGAFLLCILPHISKFSVHIYAVLSVNK